MGVCIYCERPTRDGSLCWAHEQRQKRGYPPMDAPVRGWSRGVRACVKCGGKYFARGLCRPCYMRDYYKARKEKGNASREA